MFIISDVHSESPLMKPFLESEEKYCLQLGDFGFLWKYSDKDWNHFLNKFEKDYPNKIIFTIFGNHENYNLLAQFPREVVNNAMCYVVRKNVFVVCRGEVLEVEGYRILCVGGGDSIDRYLREQNISWWPQELITTSDIEKAVSAAHNIDIVATHAMPTAFMMATWPHYPQMLPSELQLTDLMRQIEWKVCWYGGHVHENLKWKYCGMPIESLGIGEYRIIEPKNLTKEE